MASATCATRTGRAISCRRSCSCWSRPFARRASRSPSTSIASCSAPVATSWRACATVTLRAIPVDPAELEVAGAMPTLESLDAPALYRCMVKLDLRSRVVVQMCFHDEATADEIGAHLGTTAGNVRVLRHRAIAQLRRCLDRRAGGRCMSATCTSPLSFETLVAYWAGDLPQAETDAVDAHVIGCATCAAASERVAAITEGIRASISPVISGARARRPARARASRRGEPGAPRASAPRSCSGATSTCWFIASASSTCRAPSACRSRSRPRRRAR